MADADYLSKTFEPTLQLVIAQFPHFWFLVWFGLRLFGFGLVWFQNRKIWSVFGS